MSICTCACTCGEATTVDEANKGCYMLSVRVYVWLTVHVVDPWRVWTADLRVFQPKECGETAVYSLDESYDCTRVKKHMFIPIVILIDIFVFAKDYFESLMNCRRFVNLTDSAEHF